MGDFRTDRTRYPTHSAYVKPARDRVRQTAKEWSLPESVVDDLALIASELVTNAVQHVDVDAGREIGVTLFLSPLNIRLEVRDSGEYLPTPREPSNDEQSGRGLILVRLIANRWGFKEQVVGKTVFAEIDLKPSQLSQSV